MGSENRFPAALVVVCMMLTGALARSTAKRCDAESLPLSTAPSTQPTDLIGPSVIAGYGPPSPHAEKVDPAEPASPLPTMVVHGRNDDLVGIAETANQGVIGGNELAHRPLLRPAEVLESVPGLVITQHSGPGKANQYFLRGFQLDHGTDFSTTLDGVPQNLPSNAHGQGYMDLNYLMPELILGIDYRKGPYYARDGDFSLAGSADVHYVDRLDRGIFSLTGGSYDYERAFVADSLQIGRGDLLYAFEFIHEGGPFDVPDNYKHLNAIVKYTVGDVANGYRLSAYAYHSEWTATNQVAEQAIDNGVVGRFGSLNPSDGGLTDRYTVVGETYQKTADTRADLLGFLGWYDLDLFNDFTYFLNDPVHGDQFEQQDRRIFAGMRGSYEWDAKVFGRDSTLTVGVQSRNDDIRDGLYNTQSRDRISVVRKDYVVETTVGLYIQNRTQWLDKFRTEGGIRADYLNLHVDSDKSANSGVGNAVICSPSLNLIFGPWEKTEFYLSGGEGFHSNDARGVTTTIVPSTLTPAARATPLVRGDGAEVGIRSGIIPGLQSTISLWVLKLHSEQTFNGDTAESVPAGPTLRYGVELSNYYTPNSWLTIDADYSLSRAKFTDNEPAGGDVPESIQNVVEAGVTFHDLPPVRNLFGSLRFRYFGPRPLTQDDSVQSESSALMNAELGYHFTPAWALKLNVLNLFNVKTNDIEYDYNYRLPGQGASGASGKVIHPAEPMEFRVSVEARF